MTPTALAERYIREAANGLGAERADEVLGCALRLACADLIAERNGGFDRSATLARAVKRKAEEDADGHHAL